MMKSADGIYINIHEAGLVNYPAMQLHVNRADLTLISALVPDAVGNKAYLHAPFATPWRTVIVSDKATEILASKLILNLNEPSKLVNTDWFKPMKFAGVWWEMQTGKATWSYSDYADSVNAMGALIPSGKHGATTANVKRTIDFAAKNNIQGVLVEGWSLTPQANSGGTAALALYGKFWDQEKLRVNDQAFYAPTREGLETLRTQYGVRWLFADKRVRKISPELDQLAALRFESRSVQVYELIPG